MEQRFFQPLLTDTESQLIITSPSSGMKGTEQPLRPGGKQRRDFVSSFRGGDGQ